MAGARLGGSGAQGRGTEGPGKNWGVGGDDGWSRPVIPVPHDAPTPNPGLPSNCSCLCFLARDPITTDYYNWGQFQKPREGEVEEEEGEGEEVLSCRSRTPQARGSWKAVAEEKEAGPRFGWVAELGGGGRLALGAGAREQSREEMCGRQSGKRVVGHRGEGSRRGAGARGSGPLSGLGSH